MFRVLLALLLVALAACGGEATTAALPQEAGQDASTDPDASSDVEAAEATPDASLDAQAHCYVNAAGDRCACASHQVFNIEVNECPPMPHCYECDGLCMCSTYELDGGCDAVPDCPKP